MTFPNNLAMLRNHDRSFSLFLCSFIKVSLLDYFLLSKKEKAYRFNLLPSLYVDLKILNLIPPNSIFSVIVCVF